MKRTRKRLLVVSVACAGIVMALLLAASLAAHLLANRKMVRSFIVNKAARATGGDLVYGRLEVSFFPLPHLEARHVYLRRPGAFKVDIEALSVYPKILPILQGRVSIHRLSLTGAKINIFSEPKLAKTPAPPADGDGRRLEEKIGTVIGGLFGALAGIDPGTDLRIEKAAVTLAFADAPDIQFSDIQATVENNDSDLSLNLQGRSNHIGTIQVSVTAAPKTKRAGGQITLTDMNLRPLLVYASLPGGITTQDTRATCKATFTVDGPEAIHSRFDLRFPSLAVMRKNLKLNLQTAVISGAADYTEERLSLSIETLQSAQPPLTLSAAAMLKPASDAGRSIIEIQAAANDLDVAVAAAATRAVAGDLDQIRTAFSVAKEGHLTNATYVAEFETRGNGLRLTKMKASGHLNQALVTIPGIEADIDRLDGDVVYEDQSVEFNKLSGHFKGAAFKELDAAIDWEEKSTLKIASPSVTVDAAPMYAWLTDFNTLRAARGVIASASGHVQVTGLEINGPLTEPQKWSFLISGSPEQMRLASPKVPFAIGLSGGKITFRGGNEQYEGVRIDFLDGSLVSSYQSKGGILSPESATWRFDGSMGPAAIAWLSTILPIPEHLQMKPPVDISDLILQLNDNQTFSLMGKLRTAGGVELSTDFSVSPKEWHIRRFQFTDGSSQLTAAAHKGPNGIDVDFSGNVEETTADRLLADNQSLSGRLEGKFHAVIDTRALLNSSFSGKLAGEGLHIRNLVADPIDVNQFSIEGDGGRLKIAPSEVSFRDNLLVVDGMLENGSGDLTFDLNVNADRLNDKLFRAFAPIIDNQATPPDKPSAAIAVSPHGKVSVTAGEVAVGGFTWSQVLADIRVGGNHTGVRVHQADLCGISTTGELALTPNGVRLHVTPHATQASLQKTANCLWQGPVKAEATYDISGEINLPPTRQDPVRFMSGDLEFSSTGGRIEYASVLLKIFSILNVTEVFTGGKSDLTENGYGYKKASATARINGGKLQFDEILLDGNSLKITGQGHIDLNDRMVDIMLLAAPLKTVDRIVSKIPIISYISGGSLVTIPMRVEGEMSDLSVVPIPPSAVGKGLIGIMGRALKAPFRLVESAAKMAPQGSDPTVDTTQKGP